MNIISDFSDIARRMNRKPEKVAAVDNSAAAAVKTLQSLGYTYKDGAEMWKPPLGNGSAIPSWPIADANYNNALFGLQKAQDLRRMYQEDYLRGLKEGRLKLPARKAEERGVSCADVVGAWQEQAKKQKAEMEEYLRRMSVTAEITNLSR